MLDWLIIGGGVHGTYLSHVLSQGRGADAARVRVLDDHSQPLAGWKQRAQACGMVYLRSPQAHHLDLPGDSLRRYAREHFFTREAFTAPYRRPALALFDAHVRHVLARAGLRRLRLGGRARRIAARSGGYRIVTDAGELQARRVLLALGPPAPRRPSWAAGLPHVFDPGFTPANHASGRVAVIGGGATGAQLAITLAERGARIDLVARNGLSRANFDSDPCFLGPRCLSAFARRDAGGRRRAISAARQPGTLPRDVYQSVLGHPRIRVWRGGIAGQTANGLRLDGGRALSVDRVLLATGHADEPPGGALTVQIVSALSLPVTPAGWPLLQPDLQWRPGLFVSGRLAELELGPAAGNIAGARMAGKRLRMSQKSEE